MSTVTKTFSDEGVSAELLVRAHESFTYEVDYSADFDGGLFLEYSDNGGLAWVTVRDFGVGFKTDVSSTTVNDAQPGNYRFRCILDPEADPAVLTGTAAVTLADVVETVQSFQDQTGVDVLRTVEGAVSMPLDASVGGKFGIGTTTPDYKLDIEDTQSPANSGLTVVAEISNACATVGTNAVHTNIYSLATSASTADNTGNAAHILSLVGRAQDATGGLTDIISIEGRVDPRSTSTTGPVEYTAVLGMVDAVMPAATETPHYFIGLRSRVWLTEEADGAGTEVDFGTCYGLYIETIKGGAANQHYGIYQQGSTDINLLSGPLDARGGVVFNEAGADVDFRVESDGDENAIFVDAGNNRVGIMNGSPLVALDVTGDILASGVIATAGAFLRLITPSAPASAGAAGNIGTISWDTGFIYVCTATNTWKRVAIATW